MPRGTPIASKTSRRRPTPADEEGDCSSRVEARGREGKPHDWSHAATSAARKGSKIARPQSSVQRAALHGPEAFTIFSTITQLAQRAIAEPSLIDAELSWLVTAAAKNAFRFGHELGSLDTSHDLLPRLMAAQKTH